MAQGGSALATWISENPDATVGAVTLAVTVAAYLAKLWLTRKRITYRVHLDSPVGVTPKGVPDMIEVELRNKNKTVPEPSFALVRIMNTGSREIHENDLTRPLTLEFGGRRVVDAQIVEARKDLREEIAKDVDWPPPGDSLVLPRVPLNRKDRIKVLVLLSGPVTREPAVDCHTFLRGGRVVRDTARGNGPNRRSMVLGGLALLLVGASLVLLTDLGPDPSESHCAAGAVTISGSSAFEAVTEKVAARYRRDCGDAVVEVDGGGTIAGLQQLSPSRREERAAMSDGPAPFGDARFTPHTIAVVPFAVVVSDDVPVRDLTADRLRAIFLGEVTNWAQVGGPDRKVLVVSRDAKSGTRDAFRAAILDGADEPAENSPDCATASNGAGLTRCELNSTGGVLEKVAEHDNAIGYADLPAADRAAGVEVIAIDGVTATREAMADGRYRFWIVEYLYTYGRGRDDGLLSRFTRYLSSDDAKAILREEGYFPCGDPWPGDGRHPCDAP
ncbi:substrate-binding domain-containing protein [Actinosynnema sp. NPDC059797]